jgi:hypothetical protein
MKCAQSNAQTHTSIEEEISSIETGKVKLFLTKECFERKIRDAEKELKAGRNSLTKSLLEST